ncbi:MAG: 7-carboxy-7-deazaguanine synthase QueE [Deltaproteobacteria bacterium]|nr:MAG: 7-carboxy-7-deazaguanine synthase QueE [Deltaproteobacteria bacterium]
MENDASIIEIFSSYQGEGTHVGERQLFIRFQDCELSCKFCDTPLTFVPNKFCRLESPAFSKKYQHLPNPISQATLNKIIGDFNDETIVLTGGEPLQKVYFLREWLPQVKEHYPQRKIMVETAGVHFGEFIELAEWIDIVSMDIKLPSSTGMHPWWREHEAFLKAVQRAPSKKETYIKIVISGETEEKDILKATQLIASMDATLPVILQPASLYGRFRSIPTIDQIAHWEDMIKPTLKNLRIIPQIHKQMGIL